MTANFCDKEWHDITILRGQLVTSRQRLALETGLTEKVVRRCLKSLEKTGEIIVQSTNKYSLITVCHYSDYQGDMSNKGQQRTGKGPSDGQPRAINKKFKERKNGDTSLRSVSPSPCPLTDGDKNINHVAFMEFFNRTIQQYQSQIPTITQITPKRRTALNARAKEFGKEALRKAVINAATAPVLNGATDKPFVASFDWIFRPNNFPKVLEGNYNHSVTNKNPQIYGTGSNNGYRTSDDLRAGAARIIAEFDEEAKQPKKKLPVV